MTTVQIYTTSTCPWCKKVKEFLKQKKIPYKELDVSDNLKAREALIKKSGQMGVPVLDIDGKIIVGYDPDAIMQVLSRSVATSSKTVKKPSTSHSRK